MYKKSKKSQGMSINVIIIVAICLIVLVVLIAVFTGRMGGFTRGVDTTATCNNACSSLGMEMSAVSTELAANGCTSTTENYRAIGGGRERYRDLVGTQQCCCVPT